MYLYEKHVTGKSKETEVDTWKYQPWSGSSLVGRKGVGGKEGGQALGVSAGKCFCLLFREVKTTPANCVYPCGGFAEACMPCARHYCAAQDVHTRTHTRFGQVRPNTCSRNMKSHCLHPRPLKGKITCYYLSRPLGPLYLCVCVFARVQMQRVHIYMSAQDGCAPLPPEADSSLEVGSMLWPDWLASAPWGTLVSVALRFQHMLTYLVSVWALGQNSSPHTFRHSPESSSYF